MLSSIAMGASKITSIEFKGTQDPSELTIQADGPLSFEKQENEQDKQVVLEIKDAILSKSNSRKIDTSSFNSNVALISPYSVKNQPNTVRIVIQLRQMGSVEATQEGNSIHVKIQGTATPSVTPEKKNSGNSSSVGDEKSSITSSSAAPDTTPEPVASPSVEGGEGETSAASSGPKSRLEQFTEAVESKKFSGTPVTLQVRDTEITDVLRLIGEASGFNIVVADGVRGKITISLVDVPWDQALDVILRVGHLGAERSNNILRISTLDDLTAARVKEHAAEQAAQANAPRLTKVFPISYADLSDLATIITKFASTSSSSSAAGGVTTSAGIVQVDARTNSIIIQDVPKQIEKMKKLIEILDTQTPQVMIEAKVIEATEGFTKSLNGSLGISSNATGNLFASFSGANPIDQMIGSPGVFASGSGISAQSPQAGTFGLSPSLSFIPGSPRLNALLTWGETESQLRVVASPKTVVLNKQTANIVQGTPVLVPGTTTVAGVGTVPTSSVQQANVSLKVKPTVTNQGSVLLDLTVSKDIPIALAGGNQGIGNRNMQTLVLVDSGSTLVIGGIYSMQSQRTSSGFPILRKIPILGALFGSENDNTDRTELFIFITPRILNSKEAGISG
ncbi:MAG: type IV pilus secretin PilQ [Bdellovibrio sp.]|nr:type IV pilus secretin PilQ [Bdellovibrio sp.]